MITRVRRVPLGVIGNLICGSNPRRFGRQRHPLRKGRTAEVVQDLRVTGRADQARIRNLPLDVRLVAVHRNDGNVLPQPRLLFEDFSPRKTAPLDLGLRNRAGLNDGRNGFLAQLGYRLLVVLIGRGSPIFQQVKGCILFHLVEVFTDPNLVIARPAIRIAVAIPLRYFGVRVLGLVLLLEDVELDKAVFSIRPVGHLMRAQQDRKGVTHPPNGDLLVERLGVRVLGQDADVAEAIPRRMVQSRVKRIVRIGAVADRAD